MSTSTPKVYDSNFTEHAYYINVCVAHYMSIQNNTSKQLIAKQVDKQAPWFRIVCISIRDKTITVENFIRNYRFKSNIPNI